MLRSGYKDYEPVNLGTGKEISIRELAEVISEATEFRGEDHLGYIEAEWAATSAPFRRVARRATIRLQSPHTPFREGIKRTVDLVSGDRSRARRKSLGQLPSLGGRRQTVEIRGHHDAPRAPRKPCEDSQPSHAPRALVGSAIRRSTSAGRSSSGAIRTKSLRVEPHLGEGDLGELAHRVGLAGRYDVVARRRWSIRHIAST